VSPRSHRKEHRDGVQQLVVSRSCPPVSLPAFFGNIAYVRGAPTVARALSGGVSQLAQTAKAKPDLLQCPTGTLIWGPDPLVREINHVSDSLSHRYKTVLCPYQCTDVLRDSSKTSSGVTLRGLECMKTWPQGKDSASTRTC
jgi:hypothetical protein